MYANSPRKRPATPEVCPVCGEDVPRNAPACPQCGADHRSGWREDVGNHDGAGLPDDEAFDYDEYVEREFGGPSVKPRGVHPVWWVTAVVLILTFLYLFLRPFYHFF